VDAALNGEGSQRPNLVAAGGIYPSTQTVGAWLNRSAFAVPAAGVIGNLGSYNVKGPSIFQLSMSVSRSFAVGEKQTIQLRAEAFNLPNHLNPAVPVSALNSAAFGQIQADISGTNGLSAGDPRIIQLALKYVF